MVKQEQKSLTVSSKDDKGEDITFTLAMTEALRISCMEACNKSQSSPSKGSSKRIKSID